MGETGTKAPKAPTFDILGYQKENKGYYGDIPLEEVAKDIYSRGGYVEKYPDYDTWKKAKGIEPIIQEDIKRRTPPPPSFLDKVMGAIPFRYDEESIQGRLYRYDRFTKTVEMRRGMDEDESTAKWVPIPRFKNLQHARDILAKRARDRQNRELNRNIEDLKEELERNIEDLKREQKFRDIRNGRP